MNKKSKAIQPPSLTLLRDMESFIPFGEGNISLRLFTDNSWQVQIEYQSIIIADPSSSDLRIWLKEGLIQEVNPEWIPEVRDWFIKIETIWNHYFQ